MSEIKVSQVTEIDNVKVRELAMRVVLTMQLAVEKATAHQAEPATYPISSDVNSFEQLFLSRFQQLRPEQQQVGISNVMAAIKAPESERVRIYGDLAKVDLHSETAVEAQTETLLLPDSLKSLQIETNSPLEFADEVLSRAVSGLTHTLELRIHRVKCIEDTNETGRDEISLGGNTVDESGNTKKISKMAQVIGHKNFVFVADCKAGSIATRAQIAANGGIYCVPVPTRFATPPTTRQWLLSPPAETVSIRLPRQDEEEPAVGKGFEVELGKFWLNEETNKWVRWHERYLVVYSQSLAASIIRGQQQRILVAQTALDKLAAKPGEDRGELIQKVENILHRYRVNDFFSTTITEVTLVTTRHVGRGRPSKNSTTEEVTSICLQLHIQQVDDAIKAAEILAGWRLYVTNAPTTRLTLLQAVMYYRDEWLLERGFHRFKRGSLPALPIYFQNEDRITGLMFVLNIALRLFTLMEFVVRRSLQQTQQFLAGLYDGNPKRKTNRPSAERILQAFCHLTLYLLPDSTIFITPLSTLQKQILSLMNMPESLDQVDTVQYST